MTSRGPAPSSPAPAPSGTVLLLGTLLAVSTFNYTDRILLAYFAEPLKRELLLSDAQLGLLGGLGFALVYTLFGLFIGRLADRRDRVAIIAFGTIVWSAATVACGFATGFAMLLLARAAVGLGEACFLPPTASLLADRFPPDRRGGAMSVVQLGSPIALLIAALATFWIGPAWGWRAAFWLIGGAGILAGAAVLLLIRDDRPVRSRAAHVEAGSLWRDMAAVLAAPALRHVIAGGTLALFAMGSIGQFLPPFFVRSHGLDFGSAALLVGPIQFGAALTGLLIGGYGSDLLARRDPRWRVWLPGCGILLGAVAYFVGFSMSAILPAAIGIGLGGIGLLSYLPPTLSLVQNLVPASQRGVAIAVYTLISGIIGTGIGPGLVGWISDAFAARAFAEGNFASLCPGGHAVAGSGLDGACRAAAAAGLNGALLCCCAILVWAAAHYLIAARHLRFRPGA